MTKREMRIATRGSPLALWQANAIRDGLLRSDPSLEVELHVVRTKGDRVTDAPLSQIGDRGLFTREVDAAVLEGDADIAVHSLKDLPTRVAGGLALVAVTEREDPRDVLVGPMGANITLESLPAGARVGTSSLRRRAQLLAARPDLRVLDLRGNLNTRLQKLDDGGYEAIVLAAAGVLRLGMRERISHFLADDRWLPAVGQGALGVIAREDDDEAARRLAALHHRDTGRATLAERTLLRDLEGGCQIPLGALGRMEGERLHLAALVADLEGTRVLRASLDGSVDEPEALGLRLSELLRERGAEAILAEIRASGTAPSPPAP